MNQYAAVFAVSCLAYQNSPEKLAVLLFPGRHPDYLAEWTDRFAEGLTYAIGKMSEDTFRRFVDLALAEHGEHAQRVHPG